MNHKETFLNFCHNFKDKGKSVALFDVDSFPPMLRRSKDCDRLLFEKSEACKERDTNLGILYIMHWGESLSAGNFLPLYIGITQRLGRKGKISSNLKCDKERDPYCRWGYSDAYHMGKLNNAAPNEGKYHGWVDALFENWDTEKKH